MTDLNCICDAHQRKLLSFKQMKNMFTIVALLLLCATSCMQSVADKKIAVQTLGVFPQKFKDSIAAAVHRYFGFEVVELPQIQIPERFFTNVKSPRYRADSIIALLRTDKPDSVDYVIGLTSADISVSKRDSQGNIRQPQARYADWGVFGFGYIGQAGCVVSTFRIYHKNLATVVLRMQKIALHEIGHNLGLAHCTNNNCFMRDAAESIKTIDQVEINLCENCKSKIQLKH